jgi:coenzyme F420-reducing hydrogenase delta subunit
MSQSVAPDVIVYVCANCLPQAGTLPRQWKHDGAHVLVREMPCTGKVDVQYLFHAIEGGARGLCVVACPKGECHLAQGNYRAEIRVRTMQRLLSEIDIEPQRAVLLHCSPNDPAQQVRQQIQDAVVQICGLGPILAVREKQEIPSPSGRGLG